MYSLLRFVPKAHVSFLIGKLAHIPLPAPLANVLVRYFARHYQIDLSEIRNPIESFPSIGSFFTRELKPGLRPLGASPVSPADGVLRDFQRIQEDTCIPVKGTSFTVQKLLGEEDNNGLARYFLNGTWCSVYLSPKDYHHVHSPVSGKVVEIRWLPGRLWPVNDWSLEAVNELFAVNERVVVVLESEVGKVAVILVGATNVGSISLTVGSSVQPVYPVWPWQKRGTLIEDIQGSPLVEGERLGTFHLGSTVVVLFEKEIERPVGTTPRMIRMGESL